MRFRFCHSPGFRNLLSKFAHSLIILCSILIPVSVFAAQIERIFTGATEQSNSFITGLIFLESDALFLNGRLLTRNEDYKFNRQTRSLDLSKIRLSSTDTLVIRYRQAPLWLAKSFGRQPPEIQPPLSRAKPESVFNNRSVSSAAKLSDINISGAKTFRFSTQSAGVSEFGQSLDLNIAGDLTENLTISGSISDRGFNPSYGTANSRLEELDKINLRLESRSFLAQIGDIQISRGFRKSQWMNKQLSGVAADLKTGNFSYSAVAGRPKGRFQTETFNGLDGVQGPYQIGTSQSASSIVPNSENIWLDGRKLSRGADKDYTMDYAGGRITFSVKNQIDSRSRIEIDYEPLLTAYKTELFSAASSYQYDDSVFDFSVEWYHEGDSKEQPQTGELSNSDIQLLSAVGDNTGNAFRSGVILDSAGSYLLVTDSLPDSLYQFAGQGNGDYKISFSYVGAEQGDYLFVGGEQYQYAGSGKGEYLPVVKLAAPEQKNYYSARLGLQNRIVGEVQAEISFSRYDKNLFSALDDSDNEGLLANLRSRKTFNWNGQENNLSVTARFKEAAFSSDSRINAADFGRHYLLPVSFKTDSDEKLIETNATLSPFDFLKLSPSYGRLNYDNNFSANKFAVKTDIEFENLLSGSFLIRATDSRLTDSINSAGHSQSYISNLDIPLVRKLKFQARYEHDSRNNDYKVAPQGLKYDRYAVTLLNSKEKITVEHYTEDSLTNGWSQLMTRNRLIGSSGRTIGHLNYNIYLGYQWLFREDASEESFLSRADWRYANNKKRLSISSSYTLSEETRNARGITYLEVAPGLGKYIFDNGRYLPDPDGNFIRTEEILSEKSKVRRGEKSFHLSKSWSFAQIQLNSVVEEELLENGQRTFWWFLPFYSDDAQPYLVYNRRHSSDIRLIQIKSGHAINISLKQRIEIRNIAGVDRIRRDFDGTLSLKQSSNDYFFVEEIKLFRSNRDNYFIGSGDIDGFKSALTLRKLASSNEYAIGLSFRKAQSSIEEKSEIFSIETKTKIRMMKKGEIRTSLELYTQSLDNVNLAPSYQLTGNKFGSRGVLWTAAFNYGIKKDMRINLRLSGRHSDKTTARITGRTEVVAQF